MLRSVGFSPGIPQRFDSSDMQWITTNRFFRHIILSWLDRYRYSRARHHDELRVRHIIAGTVRNMETKRLEGLRSNLLKYLRWIHAGKLSQKSPPLQSSKNKIEQDGRKAKLPENVANRGYQSPKAPPSSHNCDPR